MGKSPICLSDSGFRIRKQGLVVYIHVPVQRSGGKTISIFIQQALWDKISKISRVRDGVTIKAHREPWLTIGLIHDIHHCIIGTRPS